MLSLIDIRSIHLELTTSCNARCPCCPRNLSGYDHNDGYPECNLTLDKVKNILDEQFLRQIKHIYISGNFGDFVMNPQSVEILQYLRNGIGNDSYICIGTNGGARDKNFWQQVAELSNEVIFCIDGLEDTHSIYRKNTLFKTVINNAKIVIEAKGRASWKFIVFDHNRHQIAEARQLSQELGFSNFFLHDHGRSQTPVFDRNGNFEYHIGDSKKEPIKIEWILNSKHRHQTIDPDQFPYERASKIACESLRKKEIYIAANGEVYPCCFMGHYPLTFQKNMNTWYGHVGMQLRDIVRDNNALEHGLESALAWFDSIQSRWQKTTWGQGRLVACDTSCGEKSPYHNDKVFTNDNNTN
jgi:MoaA/NifB/PqqE/SkfB family radical SAM enzyme